ncbi:hypothetical protein C8R44DRAFT_146115 [Mycena epipterygia]|nr:hypothetical protein C8R44DRAFT_146115 [Mycena epipterygia]
MSVCPQRRRAVRALRVARPAIRTLSPIFRLRPRLHPRRSIPPLPHPLAYACLPCRLNAPTSGHGLHTGRKTIGTLRPGVVVLCKDHYEQRRSRFCGVYLRDGVLGRMVKQDFVCLAQEALTHAERPLWEVGQIYHQGHPAADAAREARAAAGDDHACRAEWHWGCAVFASVPASFSNSTSNSTSTLALSNTTPSVPEDAETPLPHSLGCVTPGVFVPTEPVVRAAVSAFLNLGDGTVQNVLVVRGERQWLRAHTCWSELMEQAVAARRFNAGGYNTSAANPGVDHGRQDYSDYATTVLVNSGDRGQRRARNASLESVEEYDERQKQQKRPVAPTDAYANNAANNAAYARAGNTNTTTADDYLLDKDDYDLYNDEEEDENDNLELDGELDEGDGEGELAAALEVSVRSAGQLEAGEDTGRHLGGPRGLLLWAARWRLRQALPDRLSRCQWKPFIHVLISLIGAKP